MRTALAIFLFLALGFSSSSVQGQVVLLSSLENDFEVAPGGSYSGKITVRNTTSEPREIRVYQNDARYEATGTKYLDPGSLARSNAEWISFAPDFFTVPAQQDFELAYRITVPEADYLLGSYWSVIMLESVVSNLQAENPSLSKGQIRLGVKFRYAVQVAAHVQGGGFGAEVTNFAVLTEDDRAFLQIDLLNEGKRMGRPVVWVELYDDAGNLIGSFDGIEKRLYPGSITRQRIPLGSPAAGEYKALVLVDGGADELFGAQYTLRF